MLPVPDFSAFLALAAACFSFLAAPPAQHRWGEHPGNINERRGGRHAHACVPRKGTSTHMHVWSMT